MSKPTILVTGATGKTGGAVVRQLLDSGYTPRALVHREDARSGALRQAGAQVVVADMFDPEQLTEAMRGAARAYYCPPFHPHMIQGAVAFAVAARAARLESIVCLSQWLSGPSHPSHSTRQHWLADRLLEMVPGVACTTVAPGFFASFPYLELIGYAAQLGVFPLPADGESRNAPPSNEDIARVAVAALLDPDRHAGKTYRPTGPEMISVNDMVRIIGKVVGHKVWHLRIPMWMFLKAARMNGVEPVLLASQAHYLRDQNDGAFALGGPTDHVLEVTGRQPEDFETIARRYAALPMARQTLANRAAALGKFMTVPFQRGLNAARYEKDMGFPMPHAPRFAMDNPDWRANRTAVAATGRHQALRLAVPA